jgi:hypothetical protein
MSVLILSLVLAVSVIANVSLIVILTRFSKRLLQFDELFELLSRDIDVNIAFFDKLLATPLFDDSQEVRTANQNMTNISKRLNEFVLQMEETSNRKLRPEIVIPNPPVVK